MEENKQKKPLQQTTKDDSSDPEKVGQGKQAPPPEPETNREQRPSSAQSEDEEAEKGHS